MKRRPDLTSRMRRGAGCALAVVLWSRVAVAVSAAAFTSASRDRDTTYVGESVTLSLTFEGGAPHTPPAVPGVLNLRIVPAGQQNSFQIINGVTSSSLTYNYQITPV